MCFTETDQLMINLVKEKLHSYCVSSFPLVILSCSIYHIDLYPIQNKFFTKDE